MNELLFILLPLAVFTGWWVGRAETKNNNDSKTDDYLKGLSYLLEDETDKAIEVFFRIANVDEKTVENQITLGNLFRQKGEIDRALHIHSNLENKQTLTPDSEHRLSMALAEDYLAAGIMNRAEAYFLKVSDNASSKLRDRARNALIEIYSDQKQWQKAVDISNIIDPFQNKREVQKKIAYFYCEMAKECMSSFETAEDEHQRLVLDNQSIDCLNQALLSDENCVRASIKLGRIACKKKLYIEAISHFQRIEEQQPNFMMDVLDDMEQCYIALNQEEEWLLFLKRLYQKMPNSSLLLRLVSWVKVHLSEQEAKELLVNSLNKNPDLMGIKAYLDLSVSEESNTKDKDLSLVQATINKLLAPTLSYRCDECGFRSKELNWQCPGCKQWGTSKMISGVSIQENAS